MTGHLLLFLHAHLPYVRHPEHEYFLEEDWLYEAITETYIPLLTVAESWIRDRIRARLTVSISPTLLEMLGDDLLMERYSKRLQLLVELAESEVRRNLYDDRFRFTAQMYRDRFADVLHRFENVYNRDLIKVFKRIQAAGIIEVVTSCATHSYLPCFDSTFAQAQVRVGIKTYRRHFGSDPLGMWLPECGFIPGIDRILADEGLHYFLVDSHGVEFAEPRPVYGTYSPIVSPSSVFAFPRDRESSAQVWSAEWGYPGDGRYREFYRDVGYDLADLPAAFRLPNGDAKQIGIKYHRITGRSVPLHEKQPYHHGLALEAVQQHSSHFVAERTRQMRQSSTSAGGRPSVIVAPYDAELFGHWWFEGPDFLDCVVRKVASDVVDYKLSCPADVMESGLQFQVAMPAASSWGAFGYSNTWINEKNCWIWPHLHHGAEAMTAFARNRAGADGIERRALNQLARELLLATSSDWPFMISMDTTVDYANQRIISHVGRFNKLLEQITNDVVDEAWLSELENRDNLFHDIDFRDFGKPAQHVR